MARFVNVAVGQLGPVARGETRTQVVTRLMALMRRAHTNGCDLIVYPELALTTFFPRWSMEDQAEIDFFFEREMPGPETRALFDLAGTLASDFAWVTPNWRSRTAKPIGTTRLFSWTSAAKPFPNTARCICRATPNTSPGAGFNIWKSVTSSRVQASA